MIPSVITVAYQTSRPDELDTNEVLVSKYHTLVHCRHDILHHLANCILGLADVFGQNTTLKKEFGDLLPETMLKYSPDLVSLGTGTCFVGDVSCTWNREFHLNEKKAKYDQIIETIRMTTDLEVFDFYLFWVDPSWSNLEESLDDFYRFLSINNLPFNKLSEDKLNQARSLYEDLAEDIELVKRSVPGELLIEITRPSIEPRTIDVDLLNKKSNQHFKHFSEIQSSIKNSTLDDVEDVFEKLIMDDDVYDRLRDTRHDETMFEKAFAQIEDQENAYPVGHIKPTFFVPFADFDQDISEMLGSVKLDQSLSVLKPEQRQVLQLLTFVTSSAAITNRPIHQSISKILNETLYALESPGELNMFNTGMLTGNLEKESSLNNEYTKFRSEMDSSVSKRQFFRNALNGGIELRDTLPYVYKNKCIRLTSSNLNQNDWFIKSGTAYRKSHEVRDYKFKTTIGQEHSESLQDFMDLLNQPEDKPYKTHPFLGTESGPDVDMCKNIKNGFLERQRDFLALIQKTKAHSFSKHSSNIVSQLLHFNELNTSPNTFCLMSGGRQNCVHIVRGGSLKRGQDVGQAFFSIFITHDIKWASSVFGIVRTFEFSIGKKKAYICITPWVRLSSTKLSFMKDQYYSTLSTAYDSWTRIRSSHISRQTLQMIYTFRVCVSLSPSQKVAELLMDTRYIVMAALSTYSNVFELILDKFQPPYKNAMEKHIVMQLRRKCRQIIVHVRSSPPSPNKPGYSLNKRLQTTLGGKITMPSLWSEEIVTDMQGLFDELFVYVHTSKEPSSNYHEQVRAMNTILKFQKQYNSLSDKVQAGSMEFQEIKDWLLSGCQIGCHAQTVYWGAKEWGKRYSGLHKTTEFKESCFTEPLSELESTKACIPEVDRVSSERERTREDMDRVISNLGNLFKVNSKASIAPTRTYFKLDVNMSEDVDMVITQNLRVKVHDSLLDWIKRSGSKSDFTLDLGLWNILDNNMRVIADTCIKAQYGAKREFYVINLGAKGMARVLENSYKCLAKHCKNEMISVPGDKKLEHIQSSVNEVILSSERRQDKIFYTNGDCTKWSACETMTSFVAFNSGLEDVMGAEMTSFNNAVFSAWADKDIQIPQTILSNLKYLSDQTSYMTDSTTIHSTQNFLQGMFNYASSLKAVAATEFALHMFRKLNPDSVLFCTHLEHSDDYSLVTRAKDDATFERFRVYHKLAQRLFGINDSIKKTNVQKHFLEFISLFSFNGQLFYPNIKKTKEVGTNLPCTNFKNDVMSVASRVAEAVRLGVPLESCYFLQRVHSASLADAYSLTPGMKNGYGTIVECFSTPLELFGFPDCLPVLHYITKGSPESYRLYNYGGEKVQELYKKLFSISQTLRENDDLPFMSYAEDLGEFFSPDFSYPTRHNRLREIKKKLNLTLEQSREYFDSNLTDTLIKPADSGRFSRWLEAMYYNKSFSQAYMSVSRATMTLRHSLFSSKPCILPFDRKREELKTSDEIKFWTVKQYYVALNHYKLSDFESNRISSNMAFKLSICSYNQSISMIYNFLSTSKIIKDAPVETHTTVQKSPSPYQTIVLENKVQLLLQFLINPENFYNDRRRFLSETSLHRDISKLKCSYNTDLLRTDMSYARQVMKEVVAQGPTNSYGLAFDTQDQSILGYVMQYVGLGLFHGESYRIVPLQKTEVSIDKSDKIRFARDWKTNSDTFTEVLYQLALIYRTLKLRCTDDLEDQIGNLLTYEIPELGTTVSGFLKAVDVSKLISYKVGENAQKILAFLKMAILHDQLDMRSYLTGKLFYESTYMPKHTCPNPFDEWCVLKFQGKYCNAYLKRHALEKPVIILELPVTNRVMWFYFYTIAERVFGVISQVKFDLRMLHTYDMGIKPLNLKDNYLLESIKLFKRDPQFFKVHGKVIQTVLDSSLSNLPIVVQQVNFSHSRFSKKTVLNTISLYTIEGLSVYMGSVLMFTLPFGNLYCKNMLEVKEEDKGMKVDSIPFSIIQKGTRLMAYLKSDFTQNFPIEEIDASLQQIWETEDPKTKRRYKLKNIGNLFNLDIVNYPEIDWTLGNNTIEHKQETEEGVLDIESPMLDIPGIRFETLSERPISVDTFQMETLEMSTEPILGHDVSDNLTEAKKENKERPKSLIGNQAESSEDFMKMFERVSRLKAKKDSEEKEKEGAKQIDRGLDLMGLLPNIGSSNFEVNVESEEEEEKVSESDDDEIKSENSVEEKPVVDTQARLQLMSLNLGSVDTIVETPSVEPEQNLNISSLNTLSMFDFGSSVSVSSPAPEEIPEVSEEAEEELSLVDPVSELLNLVDVSGNIELEHEDEEFSIEATLGSIGFVSAGVSDEARFKQAETKKLIKMVDEVDCQSLESLRELITLGDQPEEELGELFETNVHVTEMPISDSSSSEESLINENPGYFQMVEHPALLEQGYMFERRSREALLPLSRYLLNSWIKPDLIQICNNPNELGNLLKLFCGIVSNRRRLKLTKHMKALVKSTIKTLEGLLGDTICPYMFAKSKAMSFESGEIKIWAVASYKSRELRSEVTSKHPSIKTIHSIENYSSNNFWAKAPLKQGDFNSFLKQDEGSITFKQNTRLSAMLSRLIPDVEEATLNLEEDYGF